MSAKAVSEASGKHVLATAGVIDEYRTACVDAASTPASLLAAHPWLASSRVCLVLIEYTSQGRGDIFEVYFIILLKPHSSACWLIHLVQLVAKPDQLIKRRGKHGLICVDVDLDGAMAWIQDRMGKTVNVRNMFCVIARVDWTVLTHDWLLFLISYELLRLGFTWPLSWKSK
jgi:ATP citrate (pro-S)-lyase